MQEPLCRTGCATRVHGLGNPYVEVGLRLAQGWKQYAADVLYPCKGCPYQEGFFHGELENHQSNGPCGPAVKRRGCGDIHAGQLEAERGTEYGI